MASAEGLYSKLRELADNEPDLTQSSAEVSRWLGRLHQAVVDSGLPDPDIALVIVCGDNMTGVDFR